MFILLFISILKSGTAQFGGYNGDGGGFGGGGSGGGGDYGFGNGGTNPWGQPSDNERIKCSNSTIELKTDWTLPLGSYELGSTCVYKIKIPSDSYATAEILQGDLPEQWYKFDNALGYSFLKPESQGTLEISQIYSLPPPEAQFSMFNPITFSAFTDQVALRIFNVARRKFNFAKIRDYDLSQSPLLSRFSDLFKQDAPIRLKAKNKVWVRTICDSGYPTSELSITNPAKYWSAIPQNIFVFLENGTERVLVDTLHSIYFNTKVYQSPIVLYPAMVPNNSPCSILAMDQERRDAFDELWFFYPGVGNLAASPYLEESKKYERRIALEAVNKPSAVVIISREIEDTVGKRNYHASWLLPLIIPDSSKLTVFDGFRDSRNGSQTIAEFMGAIETPQYFGGFARTFILDQGKLDLVFSDFWKMDQIPLEGVELSVGEGKRMGSGEEWGQVIRTEDREQPLNFELTLHGTSKSSPAALLVPPKDSWEIIPDIPLYVSNGTVKFTLNSLHIILSPGITMDLQITTTPAN